MIWNDPLTARLRVDPPVCTYCGARAWLDDGHTIRRNTPVWLCGNFPACDSYVGCHQGVLNRPLGSLASRELRRMRMSVHSRIDPYWRDSDGLVKREEVYDVVASVMARRSFHAGTAREDDIRAFNACWPQVRDALCQLRWNGRALEGVTLCSVQCVAVEGWGNYLYGDIVGLYSSVAVLR